MENLDGIIALTTYAGPGIERNAALLSAIACGHEDCDDLDVLGFDPAFKLACGRLSETGDDLMSQPSLSRLENAPSWREPALFDARLSDTASRAKTGDHHLPSRRGLASADNRA